MTALRSIFFAFSRLSKVQKAIFSGLVLAQTAGGVIDLIGIGAIGVLVMAVASGSVDFDFGGLFRIQIDYVSPTGIVLLVAIAAGSFLFRAIMNLLISLWMIRFLAGVEVHVATRMADFMFSRDLSLIRRFSASDIQYMLNGSSSALFSGTLTSFASLVSGGLFSLTVIFAFFLINPVASIVVLVYIAFLMFAIQFLIANRLVRVGLSVNENSVLASAAILDSLSAFREIAVLGAHGFFVEKFRNARQKLAQTKAEQEILRVTPRVVIEQALLLGVLGFSAWQVIGTDTADGLATLGVFLVGSIRLIGAVVPIQNAFSSLRTKSVQAASARDMIWEMEEALGRRLEIGALPVLVGSHELAEPVLKGADHGFGVEVTRTSYTYPGGEKKALNEISIRIAPGSFVALIGRSGAGKSTIADMILGLIAPDVGKVEVDGLPPQKFRELKPGLVSYVPQKPGMVVGSIAQNVALGVAEDEIDDERVWASLEMASLAGIVREIDGGIHASIGRQSDKLSGGQLQRLGLARALYPRPGLIILDEATSALDAKSEWEVTENLKRLRGDVTIVVVAHRLSTIKEADNVYVVDEGKILASGTLSQLQKSVPQVREAIKLMSFDDL